MLEFSGKIVVKKEAERFPVLQTAQSLFRLFASTFIFRSFEHFIMCLHALFCFSPVMFSDAKKRPAAKKTETRSGDKSKWGQNGCVHGRHS